MTQLQKKRARQRLRPKRSTEKSANSSQIGATRDILPLETPMANLQRNFKTLQPGRYQNNRNRLVVIQPDPEDVTITDAGVTQTRKRWTGTLYKADGVTIDTDQWFESDGSYWNQRGVTSEYDLAIFDYNSAAVPA